MLNLQKSFISFIFLLWSFQHVTASKEKINFGILLHDKKLLMKIILEYLDPFDYLHTSFLTTTAHTHYYPHLIPLVFTRYVQWLQHPPRSLAGALADAEFLWRAMIHGDSALFRGHPHLHLLQLPPKIFTAQPHAPINTLDHRVLKHFFAANDRFTTYEYAPHWYYADELPLGYDRVFHRLTVYSIRRMVSLRLPERLIFTNLREPQFHCEDLSNWNCVMLQVDAESRNVELTWQSRTMAHVEFTTVFNEREQLTDLFIYQIVPTVARAIPGDWFQLSTIDGVYLRNAIFLSNILICQFQVMYAYYYPDKSLFQ